MTRHRTPDQNERALWWRTARGLLVRRRQDAVEDILREFLVILNGALPGRYLDLRRRICRSIELGGHLVFPFRTDELPLPAALLGAAPCFGDGSLLKRRGGTVE